MRYAELSFLVLMVIYHALLLLPRHRRPFAGNYLVFFAGMALAWSLGMEGLRWQQLPPTLLLLVDLFVLFPSFATLRGTIPRNGILSAIARFLRTVIASGGLLLAVSFIVLSVAFPLPQVELTGGLPPAQRVVRFPGTAGTTGMELKVWYPAGGDLRPRSRPVSDASAWQRNRAEGGLPAFWQSHWEHLPTALVRGGKLASAGTKYPVVYAAIPEGQNSDDFGYLFEDLASRGFLVVAGGPLLPVSAQTPAFDWETTFRELALPLLQPALWLEPELTLSRLPEVSDYRWIIGSKEALKQLDTEPGDLFYASIDWAHQVLWAWGSGPPMPKADQKALALRGTISIGGLPPANYQPTGQELWIHSGKAPSDGSVGQWFLSMKSLHRADLTDSAYLKPYLALFGLKSQPDAGLHGVIRQYQAAFLHHALWGAGNQTPFGQTVPEVPGLVLTGK